MVHGFKKHVVIDCLLRKAIPSINPIVISLIVNNMYIQKRAPKGALKEKRKAGGELRTNPADREHIVGKKPLPQLSNTVKWYKVRTHAWSYVKVYIPIAPQTKMPDSPFRNYARDEVSYMRSLKCCTSLLPLRDLFLIG